MCPHTSNHSPVAGAGAQAWDKMMAIQKVEKKRMCLIIPLFDLEEEHSGKPLLPTHGNIKADITHVPLYRFNPSYSKFSSWPQTWNILRPRVINKQNVSENDMFTKDGNREDNRRRDQRRDDGQGKSGSGAPRRRKPQRNPLWPKHPSVSRYCHGKRLLTSPADVQPCALGRAGLGWAE